MAMRRKNRLFCGVNRRRMFTCAQYVVAAAAAAAAAATAAVVAMSKFGDGGGNESRGTQPAATRALYDAARSHARDVPRVRRRRRC